MTGGADQGKVRNSWWLPCPYSGRGAIAFYGPCLPDQPRAGTPSGASAATPAIDQASQMTQTQPHHLRPASGFDPGTRKRMGQQLRVIFREVMNQGIPDRHHELVERLGGAAPAVTEE